MQCEAINICGNGHSHKKGERCLEEARYHVEVREFCWLHRSVVVLGLGSVKDLIDGRRRNDAEL